MIPSIREALIAWLMGDAPRNEEEFIAWARLQPYRGRPNFFDDWANALDELIEAK